MRQRKAYCSNCGDSWIEDGYGSDLQANGVKLTLCCSCEDALVKTLCRRKGIKISIVDGGEAIVHGYRTDSQWQEAAIKLDSLCCQLIDDLRAFGSESVKYYEDKLKSIEKEGVSK